VMCDVYYDYSWYDYIVRNWYNDVGDVSTLLEHQTLQHHGFM